MGIDGSEGAIFALILSPALIEHQRQLLLFCSRLWHVLLTFSPFSAASEPREGPLSVDLSCRAER